MTTKEIPNVLAVGLKHAVWIIGGIASIASTFLLNQYDIAELKKQRAEDRARIVALESDKENVIILKTQMQTILKSIDELKQTNKDTYNVLLDMRKD